MLITIDMKAINEELAAVVVPEKVVSDQEKKPDEDVKMDQEDKKDDDDEIKNPENEEMK